MSSYSLVLAGGERTSIRGELTLGRAAGNQLRLADPAVSRRHARLVATDHGVEVHDLDSRSGTFLNGHRVAGCALALDGERLRVGDTRMYVERDRSAHETIFVPAGYTLSVGADGKVADSVKPGEPLPLRPRLRSGHRRKLLAEGAGYVIENTRSERFLSFTAEEAELLAFLDGRRSVAELERAVAEAHGERGARRFMELLAELEEFGVLAGTDVPERVEPTGWRRALRPRELTLRRAPAIVAVIYRAGGRWLFTRPARAVMALIVAGGLAAFASVLARGGVRPFHVNGVLGLGTLVFLCGRFAVVALHELGHALTLHAFGRAPRRIGVKLVAVFPYAFVDTSDMWFEHLSRRRIAVSAAGPVTDVVLAGVFALVAVATVDVARDVAFQLALGAYLGALLNLNPLLERDGYHVLADLLHEPNLRRHGREHVSARLAGADTEDSRAVRLYGVAAFGWGVVTACFAGFVAMRLAARHTADPRVAIGIGALALTAALVPTALVVLRPARPRRRAHALDRRESRSSLGGVLAAGAIDAVAGGKNALASQLVKKASFTGHVAAIASAASSDHALDYPGDDAPRAEIAAWMAEVAERKGLPRELPVMAALVESDLQNLDHGDAASVGYFQMQTTYWLERYPDYQHKPDLQMQWFIDQALAVQAERPELAADPSRWGEWVADVEDCREDLRWKYGARLEDARALLADHHPPSAAATEPGGTGATPAVATASAAGEGGGGTPAVTGSMVAVEPEPSRYADRLKAEANRIDDAQIPYLWGGGHAAAQQYGDPVTPLDCSGAVSRVLGIDPRVAAQFETWGAAGPGERVTIYANDEHVLMQIDGHFFGTSHANPGGGAGWIPRAYVSDAYLARFTMRHPPGE